MTKSSGRGFRWLPAIVLPVISFVTIAHAYLDPGTGSYLWMMLIGGLAGGLFVIRQTLKRFWFFIVRRSPGHAKNAPGSQDEAHPKDDAHDGRS
jgi:nitrate/nitrite transporter NarK